MVWTGDSSNRLAKCLVNLFDEVKQRAPHRKKTGNDGTLGNDAHKVLGNRSDHNPHIRLGSTGIVTALDINHDPAHGFDAGEFAESLREGKDPRIKYVIFNGRIFSSTVSPWKWRNRNKGRGDHSDHVHVSVVSDASLFDDTRPWSFRVSGDGATDSPGDGVEDPSPSRPKLMLGDSGPAVVELQTLLGIVADGVFGPATDQAVRNFQESRNLLVDGIVGSHTWGALTEAPSKPSKKGGPESLSQNLIDHILKLAASSDLARVRWANRGVAPIGYVKGMAVMFAYLYTKLQAGDSAARVMAAMNSGNDADDALAWYDSRFREAGMENSASGVDTLRHLFVLLIGLGMRESSGKYFEGRDKSADNTDADTAEAGLFQMSWNMRSASVEMSRLFDAYSENPDGFRAIFQEGTPAPKPSDLENAGTGEGVAYQQLCKSCPAFAVETAAIGLRARRQHWGPINRREAEIRIEADTVLRQVQGLVDSQGPIILIPKTEAGLPGLPFKLPPLGDNELPLLVLILAMLSKEKLMAEESAKPGQNADLTKVILTLLLQSMLTGKQIDITGLLTMLLTGKPVAASESTPSSSGSTQSDQLNRLIEAINALVVNKDGGKPLDPVNGALGQGIGNALNGKKTAIGVIGSLATSILSTPGISSAIGSAIPALAATPIAPIALPIFLAMTGWGVLGKLEKWSQKVVKI